MHNTPCQIFVGPVKEAIRSALLEAIPSFVEADVRFNSAERDAAKGAQILLSKEILPSLSRKEERTAGGRTSLSWIGSDGSTWARHLRSSLVVTFDVRLWTQTLEATTMALLQSVAALPRFCHDGHLLTDPKVPDPDFTGNVVDLMAMSPEFPDDVTAVSKTYYARFKVRAEGGIYSDAKVSVQARGIPRLATPAFVHP